MLDGELAQRADTNRQLKEVEKRLMLAENLVPASPLVMACGGGSGAVAMAAAMAAPSEGKERLLQHREVLVAQVSGGGSGGGGRGRIFCFYSQANLCSLSFPYFGFLIPSFHPPLASHVLNYGCCSPPPHPSPSSPPLS